MRPIPCLLLSVIVLLSGCSTEDLLGGSAESSPNATVLANGGAQRPSAERCNTILTSPAEAERLTSVTVLLADGSASSFGRHDPTEHQDWATVLAAGLPEKGNGLVQMGIFGGDVDWKFTNVTPGASRDPARTYNDKEDARACLTRRMSREMRSPPGKPQTDVLRALAEGAEQVRNLPGAKSIYIATDGLSNTGCADLRGAAIGDLSAIPHIVSTCEPELPNLTDDFTIQFLGIGNSADGWSDVKTPQRTWLVELWTALCEATRAKCGEPTAAAPQSAQVEGVIPPADADVAMPEIVIRPGNPTVLSVPASILFDIDSHKLASGRSQETLQQVVEYLENISYKRVVVAGHTDSTGKPTYNRRLSRRRATAVMRALRARQITNLTAVGHGEKQPSCVPEIKNGKADLRAMACNRRVEIIVYT